MNSKPIEMPLGGLIQSYCCRPQKWLIFGPGHVGPTHHLRLSIFVGPLLTFYFLSTVNSNFERGYEVSTSQHTVGPSGPRV